MPCYHPITGYRSKHLTANGKRSIVFSVEMGFVDMPVTVPCGQCIGCRLERSRQWALRCVHEASLHDSNCFITLTYSDDHLPDNLSVNVKHFQDFMKRFRKKISPIKIRFFHCGEYGEANHKNNYIARPHYHAAIFGFDFEDRRYWKNSPTGVPVYISDLLSSLWTLGYSAVGDLNFESAAYVARYIVKKVNGDMADEHYSRVNRETGEVHKVAPEYITMSRRPGIAAEWFDKYKTDAYPSDFITERGIKMRPPKFYDSLLEVEDNDLYEKIKKQRVRNAKKHKEDNTTERLIVREKCHKARFNLLMRDKGDF